MKDNLEKFNEILRKKHRHPGKKVKINMSVKDFHSMLKMKKEMSSICREAISYALSTNNVDLMVKATALVQVFISLGQPRHLSRLSKSSVWKKGLSVARRAEKLGIKFSVLPKGFMLEYPNMLSEKEMQLGPKLISYTKKIGDFTDGFCEEEYKKRSLSYSKLRFRLHKAIIEECKRQNGSQKKEAIFRSVARKFSEKGVKINWQTVKRIWYSRKKFVKS